MIRKTPQAICFWGSAMGFLCMAVAVFLFCPGAELSLNKGTRGLQIAASLIFWIGLLLGITLQLASLILRRREAPDYKTQFLCQQSRRTKSSWLRYVLFKNRIVLITALCFVVGCVGSIVSLAKSLNSSYHTFFFLALTILSFCEYFTFNSINFAYAIRRSDSDEG